MIKSPTHGPNKFESVLIFILGILANTIALTIMNYIDKDYDAPLITRTIVYVMIIITVMLVIQIVFSFFYAMWQERNNR